MTTLIKKNMTVLSLFSIGLVLQLDLARVHAQAPPQEYLLRITDLETEPEVRRGQSFREDDILLSFVFHLCTSNTLPS